MNTKDGSVSEVVYALDWKSREGGSTPPGPTVLNMSLWPSGYKGVSLQNWYREFDSHQGFKICRGGRVVECNGLQNHYLYTVGSNPILDSQEILKWSKRAVKFLK